MASLVQDVWLGFDPLRLRGRRLAPWEESPVRLLFHLDADETLDDAPVAALLDALADRIEVVAWEPRGRGASAGALGPGILDDARSMAAEGARRFGDATVLVGGHGLGAWVALATVSTPGVSGAVALAPSLAAAGAAAPQPSLLRTALARALAAPTPGRPTLVLEGRDRPDAERHVVAQWLEREPAAAAVSAPGRDDVLLAPPWPATIAAWALGLATGAR
jgi:alpha-beta hydrolase superfamily lysophospholipase